MNVRVPAMPGIFTWGATRDEALAAAREAIELYLEQYVERGQPLPADRKPRVRRKATKPGGRKPIAAQRSRAYLISVRTPASVISA